MYNIHFKDKRLSVCNENELEQVDSNSVIVFAKESKQITEALEYFRSHPSATNMTICSKESEETYNEICSQYELINAAGGIVTNTSGDILLIRRNNCWDLPKGKQEENEDIAETAVREVSEECGIPAHSIILEKFICRTAHTYNVYGPENLKHTFWYLMHTDSNIEPTPQTEEGITQIVWAKKEDMPQYLKETYPSIIEVFEKFIEGQ